MHAELFHNCQNYTPEIHNKIENYLREQKREDINNIKDEENNTLLHLAVNSNNAAFAEWLLAKGININATNDELEFPFGMLNVDAPSHANLLEVFLRHLVDVLHNNPEFPQTDYLPKIKTLLKALQNFEPHNFPPPMEEKTLNTQDAARGNTELNRAILSHKSPEYIKTLVVMGADVTLKNKTGTTVWHHAAQTGNIEIFTALGVQGIAKNIHATNSSGATPLHYAAHSSRSMIDYLIEQGADINAKDKNGLTPLHWAAKKGNWPAFIVLVEKYHCDFTATYAGSKTPIELARENYLSIKGMPVPDQNQLIHLTWIINYPKYRKLADTICNPPVNLIWEVTQQLDAFLEDGMPTSAWNAANIHGDTLFHLAVRTCDISLIKLMSNHYKGDLKTVNLAGNTFIHDLCAAIVVRDLRSTIKNDDINAKDIQKGLLTSSISHTAREFSNVFIGLIARIPGIMQIPNQQQLTPWHILSKSPCFYLDWDILRNAFKTSELHLETIEQSLIPPNISAEQITATLNIMPAESKNEPESLACLTLTAPKSALPSGKNIIFVLNTTSQETQAGLIESISLLRSIDKVCLVTADTLDETPAFVSTTEPKKQQLKEKIITSPRVTINPIRLVQTLNRMVDILHSSHDNMKIVIIMDSNKDQLEKLLIDLSEVTFRIQNYVHTSIVRVFSDTTCPNEEKKYLSRWQKTGIDIHSVPLIDFSDHLSATIQRTLKVVQERIVLTLRHPDRNFASFYPVRSYVDFGFSIYPDINNGVDNPQITSLHINPLPLSLIELRQVTDGTSYYIFSTRGKLQLFLNSREIPIKTISNDKENLPLDILLLECLWAGHQSKFKEEKAIKRVFNFYLNLKKLAAQYSTPDYKNMMKKIRDFIIHPVMKYYHSALNEIIILTDKRNTLMNLFFSILELQKKIPEFNEDETFIQLQDDLRKELFSIFNKLTNDHGNDPWFLKDLEWEIGFLLNKEDFQHHDSYEVALTDVHTQFNRVNLSIYQAANPINSQHSQTYPPEKKDEEKSSNGSITDPTDSWLTIYLDRLIKKDPAFELFTSSSKIPEQPEEKFNSLTATVSKAKAENVLAKILFEPITSTILGFLTDPEIWRFLRTTRNLGTANQAFAQREAIKYLPLIANIHELDIQIFHKYRNIPTNITNQLRYSLQGLKTYNELIILDQKLGFFIYLYFATTIGALLLYTENGNFTCLTSTQNLTRFFDTLNQIYLCYSNGGLLNGSARNNLQQYLSAFAKATMMPEVQNAAFLQIKTGEVKQQRLMTIAYHFSHQVPLPWLVKRFYASMVILQTSWLLYLISDNSDAIENGKFKEVLLLHQTSSLIRSCCLHIAETAQIFSTQDKGFFQRMATDNLMLLAHGACVYDYPKVLHYLKDKIDITKVVSDFTYGLQPTSDHLNWHRVKENDSVNFFAKNNVAPRRLLEIARAHNARKTIALLESMESKEQEEQEEIEAVPSRLTCIIS